MTGPQFAAARRKAGLTQVEVAALVHRHWRTVQDWELGTLPVDPGSLELLRLKLPGFGK